MIQCKWLNEEDLPCRVGRKVRTDPWVPEDQGVLGCRGDRAGLAGREDPMDQRDRVLQGIQDLPGFRVCRVIRPGPEVRPGQDRLERRSNLLV